LGDKDLIGGIRHYGKEKNLVHFIWKRKSKYPGDENMKIEILGTGCAKCKKTEKIVKKVVDELGKKAEIVKVEDYQEIINRGVMMTPAVVIDGDVKISGHVPSLKELKKILL
jgi:small redox-active disulfide protein 2